MREMGEEGRKGVGVGEMGRDLDGRSAGLLDEWTQRRKRGNLREDRRRDSLRRILARWGLWAPDLRVEAVAMEEVESETRQGDGWRERASWHVLVRANSSAFCWLVEACGGRIQEV